MRTTNLRPTQSRRLHIAAALAAATALASLASCGGGGGVAAPVAPPAPQITAQTLMAHYSTPAGAPASQPSANSPTGTVYDVPEYGTWTVQVDSTGKASGTGVSTTYGPLTVTGTLDAKGGFQLGSVTPAQLPGPSFSGTVAPDGSVSGSWSQPVGATALSCLAGASQGNANNASSGTAQCILQGASVAGTAAYALHYDGTYSGDSSGNFSIDVSTYGGVAGSGNSPTDGDFLIQGVIDGSGSVTLQSGFASSGSTSNGAVFVGTASNGQISGTWSLAPYHGTFSGKGSQQIPADLGCLGISQVAPPLANAGGPPPFYQPYSVVEFSNLPAGSADLGKCTFGQIVAGGVPSNSTGDPWDKFYPLVAVKGKNRCMAVAANQSYQTTPNPQYNGGVIAVSTPDPDSDGAHIWGSTSIDTAEASAVANCKAAGGGSTCTAIADVCNF